MSEPNLDRVTFRNQTQLERLLLEGIKSGEGVPMTDQDWEDIRQEVRTRIANRKEGQQHGADAGL